MEERGFRLTTKGEFLLRTNVRYNLEEQFGDLEELKKLICEAAGVLYEPPPKTGIKPYISKSFSRIYNSILGKKDD